MEHASPTGPPGAEPIRPPPHSLRLDTADRGARQVRLVLTGELDAPNTTTLLARLAEMLPTAPAMMVLDVAGVSFLDSSGIRCLLECRLAVHTSGREFVLAEPSAAVLQVLSITGLLETFGLPGRDFGPPGRA